MRLIFICMAIAAIALGGASSRPPASPSIIQPEIVSFTAAPRHVRQGDPVTLKWETRGMSSVTLDWAPAENTRDHWQHRGGLPPMGSLVVKPAMNTVFVLSCEASNGGTACASASVRVEIEK